MLDKAAKQGHFPKMVALSYAAMSFIIVVLMANGVFAQMLEAIGLKGYPDIYAFVAILFLGTFAILFVRGEPVAVMAVGTIASFFVLTIGQEQLVRYLTLAAVLFSIGMYGMVVSRNAVRVLMSIELMLNAVNLNLVAFARYVDPVHLRGQVFAVFILTVAAAEAAVGLAIVLAIYRNTATVDMERFKLLKW
jgi:NAD(P)H-quinone oxidoreductase subunit 4L